MFTKLSRLASALALIIVLALVNHVEATEFVKETRTMQTESDNFEVSMQP